MTNSGSAMDALDRSCNLTDSVISVNDLIYDTKASPSEEGHVMSERVSSLASNIYQEFERMIKRYDEEVVKDLMPLVVAVLESLDTSFSEKHEHDVEMELLREDNEQLLNQLEREKQQRKTAEERLLELEDRYDEEQKELHEKQEVMESASRMLELKARNATEHSNRLEEKENDTRREFTKLKERYTELLRTHMEHMERTKLMLSSEMQQSGDSSTRPRGIFQIPPLRATTQRSNLEMSQANEQKDGVNIRGLLTPNGEPCPLFSTDAGATNEASLRQEMSTANTTLTTSCSLRLRAVQDIVDSTPELDDIDDPPQMDSGGLQVNIAGAYDASTGAIARLENSVFDEVNFEDSEVLGELDDGPDLVDYDDDYDPDSEYAADESGFFGIGMHKEIENLINDNAELIETKNALNVVKDDLIAKVDELTGENEMLRGEYDAVANAKLRLKNRLTELEEELKNVKEELDKLRKRRSQEEAEDESVPIAQRKRFTRVEMARVLMERNQYKERLMELQEAVRWTEMIRASKDHPELAKEKKRGSMWNFFSNLFVGPNASGNVAGNATTHRGPGNDVVNGGGMRYSSRDRSHAGSPLRPVGDPNRRERDSLGLHEEHQRAFDFMREEKNSSASSSDKTRRERREQYRAVKAHVKKETGRIQAYGWSLSAKAHSGSRTAVSVPPVPIYCRPLLEKQPGMKVWCATGICVSGGYTRDGGSFVGVGSVFYTSTPSNLQSNAASNKKATKLAVDVLEAEVQQAAASLAADGDVENDGYTSLVWICTTAHAHSQICVLDANRPADLLDAFVVTEAHILCIASVPGVRESDYPCESNQFYEDENLLPDMSSPDSASSFGHVTFVRCDVVESPSSQLDQNNFIETDGLPQMSNLASTNPNKISDLVSSSEASTSNTPRVPAVHDGIATDSKTATLILDGLSRAAPTNTDMTMPVSSALATVWVGCQSGSLYVHSAVLSWRRCLHSVKLKDAALCIVHVRGRVLVGLADGTVAIFNRTMDGCWDLSAYQLIDLGRPRHSIRCLVSVLLTADTSSVWAGVQNQVVVLDPHHLRVKHTFPAHPRKESQVRQMVAAGDGVWVSIRLESTLRLFHGITHQHLQDVDIEPYVSKMLGTSKLGPGFSFVRITCLTIASRRLWIGTGNGVIISIPLVQHESQLESRGGSGGGGGPGGAVRVFSPQRSDETTALNAVEATALALATDALPSDGLPGLTPFVNLSQAQLSFHGHRDAVKFFVAVPGESSKALVSSSAAGSKKNTLILSGGEGYIDFRVGDVEEDEAMPSSAEPNLPPEVSKRSASARSSERSHLIVWQVNDVL